MTEKRPDLGLEEEMERKLKLDGSPSGSVANQETSKPSMGKGKGNEGNFGIYKNSKAMLGSLIFFGIFLGTKHGPKFRTFLFQDFI